MNEFQYIYMVMDDYYGFPGTLHEEVLDGYVIFHGVMTVTHLQEQHDINVMHFTADSRRLYKIKEIKWYVYILLYFR